MYPVVAGFTYGEGFPPHFLHQFLPIIFTCQVLHSPDMVHTNILGLLPTQFAYAPFDSGGVAVGGLVLPPVFRQRVCIQQDFFDSMESIMVKFAPLDTRFRRIGD